MKSNTQPAIAIIIPTRGRPEKVSVMVKNIEATITYPHQVYFYIDSDDSATIAACKDAKANFVIGSPSDKYGKKINTAYHQTIEPFLMLAADDVEFTPGWDKTMMAQFDDPKIGIVGHYDNWLIGQTGKHGSHLLVRRAYIQKFSGVEDEENTIYSTQYFHYNTDIETEQTAMKRGAFAMSKAIIYHHHWVNGESQKDATYTQAFNENMDHDNKIFNQRRHRFEQFNLDFLHQGKVMRVNQGKLSVVLPIYNCPQETRETIESLYANTYHDFELILVDDFSTDLRCREIINNPGHPNVKAFQMQQNRGCTHSWNFGVSKATGDYIAIINNDITLSKNWDVVLMNEVDKKDVYIASPYQTDPGCETPYGQAERAGDIAIRGTCFMLSRKSADALFPIPKDLVMWFNDYWLVWKCEQLKKKSVFNSEAVVFHLGSKATQSLDKEFRIFWWIVRGDALVFENITGIDTSHWKKLTAAHLPGDGPITKKTDDSFFDTGDEVVVIPKNTGYCSERSFVMGVKTHLPWCVIDAVGRQNFEIISTTEPTKKSSKSIKTERI